MNTIKVERLDHLGIIAGVIKDLGIVEMIDHRIPTDGQQEITTGEAVAAMIINGLGFSNRPLYLTPQFFENKPMALLFREGVEAQHFNRSKLGRSLEAVYRYGVDQLFSEIAVIGCQQEQLISALIRWIPPVFRSRERMTPKRMSKPFRLPTVILKIIVQI